MISLPPYGLRPRSLRRGKDDAPTVIISDIHQIGKQNPAIYPKLNRICAPEPQSVRWFLH
jgi:hypothetical protein